MMGIGTNTLGYANDAVDEAVMKVVRDGNMTTWNCPEEVYLAEKLIEMNQPWAGGVRYTRGGGEANSVCIRIARAFTGKDKVAICGYHGWHDWYVSVNLGDSDALAGHLLPGIPTGGVPVSSVVLLFLSTTTIMRKSRRLLRIIRMTSLLLKWRFAAILALRITSFRRYVTSALNMV